MYVRKYVLVDVKAEKPCEMDANVHEMRDVRPGGDDAEVDITAKLMRDLSSMSDRRQLLFGAAVGIVSSLLLTRTGKYVCIGVGTGVIVLQLATQNDYIKFNLMRALSSDEVHRPPPPPSQQATNNSNNNNEPRRRNARSVRPLLVSFFRRLHLFLVEQPNLTSGVIGGFLIGLGFS